MGLEDVETMCRWFGGEGGTPRLDRIRCRFDGEAHQSELEQLLRDVWSELFGVKSIDAEELEARRQAERSALQARRADLSEQGEPEILASLEADPDNEEMWLVYADWLQDHGDPRGEIIVREMQVSDERERRLLQRCLIDANPQLVVGDLAGVVGCQFEYRHAHIHRISINAGRQAARLCRRLAEHPATRFARCLRSSTAASAVIKPLFALVGARPIVDLSLHDTFFADTSPLGEHPKLRRLSLGYTRVHDAAPLEPLVNLESLDLYLARVTSLDALAGMTELRYLDLARTHSAESLAPIAGMKKLERLNIWSSAAANLETLLALDSLAWLRVHRGQLSEELLAALLEKRPDLEIDELGYEPR
jgi:uncharacterized protein (TIGR02996 family)